MSVIDLSGEIKEGIWTYGEMYPAYRPRSIRAEANRFFCEVFDGMSSQTGTYLETTAHVNGYEGNRLLADVEIASLVDVPCRVVKFERSFLLEEGGKITADDFERAIPEPLPPDSALLFSCGWSDWYAPDFLEGSPWLSRDAMEWLVLKQLRILGSDIPSWEGKEPVFDLFACTDTLLLAPLVNLEQSTGKNTRLTVLPLRIPGTCCAPCRAILTEDD